MDVTAEAGDTQITLTHPVNNDWVQGQISFKKSKAFVCEKHNFQALLTSRRQDHR